MAKTMIVWVLGAPFTSETSLLKIRTSMNKNSESSSKISVPSRFECHQDQLSNRQGQYPVHRGFPIVVADITFFVAEVSIKK